MNLRLMASLNMRSGRSTLSVRAAAQERDHVGLKNTHTSIAKIIKESDISSGVASQLYNLRTFSEFAPI